MVLGLAARPRIPGRSVLVALALIAGGGCGKSHPSGAGKGALVKAQSARGRAEAATAIARIRQAAWARDPSLIPAEALSSRSVEVRRAAASVMAHAGTPSALEHLRKLLADEDPEVLAWAAHGLGARCDGREGDTGASLAARAASWVARPPASVEPNRLSLDPAAAMADGLARCGDARAEATLRGWLALDPLASPAAGALGRLADRRHALEDATVVALLDAASRPTPVRGALDAFARVEITSAVARARLIEAAGRALVSASTDRASAIRALWAAGSDAAPKLSEWILDQRLPPSERCVAAVTLGKLEPKVPDAVARTFARLVLGAGAGALDDAWLTTHHGLLVVLLQDLEPGAREAREALTRLASLSASSDAVIQRRRTALRCAAASVLAGRASQAALLSACDGGAHGRSWALATLETLDRGKLEGPRASALRAFLASEDPVVRRTALSILGKHGELSPVDEVLAHALGAREPGVVAQAARVLSGDPRRAAHEADSGGAHAPSPRVVEALARALDRDRPPDEIDARVALMGAAAALGSLSLKSRIERYCKSSNESLREGAERALRTLGGSGAKCGPPKSKGETAAPLAEPTTTLTFVTDAGRLGMTLDGRLAPLSVSRIVDLARSRFFDGIAVHRVIPGSIVQLGDRGGDGYGGSGREPLPSETAPAPFEGFTVGLSLSGPDTGSSQLFVTLVPEPRLFGDYPVLGFADPEWSAVQEGDVIRTVEVRAEAPPSGKL